MNRRDLLSLLGGAAAWPVAARAQQPMPVIGYLHPDSPEATKALVAAFRKGLGEAGYFEGRNVTIEYRWANDDFGRLPELAEDLVRHRVAAIAITGSGAATLAAKTATATIPIVFSTAADPIRSGLVASLNRPGGNVTGISNMGNELSAKRLGLLHELLPGAARFAMLINPVTLGTQFVTADVQAAAAAIGREIEIVHAANNSEIDNAFATIVRTHADGLLVTPNPLFGNRRIQMVTLAARHGLPAIYSNRQFPEVGGLMSYGPDSADQARLVGVYAGRILKGEKPADLPVMQAAKFELIINLQTAKTLGITVPTTLLTGADEVIE
jgi:putative tryptophan/tyrosine transport system substrate-binding protein